RPPTVVGVDGERDTVPPCPQVRADPGELQPPQVRITQHRAESIQRPLALLDDLTHGPGVSHTLDLPCSSYGCACQFHVRSPLLKAEPPFVHWFESHTAPVEPVRLAAGSGVAPP